MTEEQKSRQRRVSVFDTTLRDGEQAPMNAMRPEQKLALALRIEALGVDAVETGFPASSPSELISQHLTTARLVTFNRAVRGDIEAAAKAAGTDNHQIQIMATGSDMHIVHKRGITRKEAVEEVHDAVSYARLLGFTDISVPIEDASRGEDDLLQAIVETALDAGARTFVIGDTSGCLTPAEYGDLIARFRRWAPDPAVISTHCHDDFGLSVANSLAGVDAGAGEIQATLGGIGERAGNTALEEVAAILLYKGEKLGYYSDIKTEDMYGAYDLLRETIRLAEPRNKSIFGEFAFGTAAGVHQQGYLRNPATYEYVEPARFGRDRTIMVGRHSGRVVLRYVLDQLDYKADDDELNELYNTYIAGRTDSDVERLDGLKAHLAEVLSVDAAATRRR